MPHNFKMKSDLRWLLLFTALWSACEPPRAVPPNMPNAEARAQATRNRLRAFNAARFEQERHEVDSSAQVHAPHANALPGGMWLSLKGEDVGLFDEHTFSCVVVIWDLVGV